MSAHLTPEQKATVSTWIAAGDSLSTVQKKLREEFKLSMTYMDVRFLVDDLGLELRNAAPKADVSDVTKASSAPRSPSPAAAEPAAHAQVPAGEAEDTQTADYPEQDLPEEDFPESPDAAGALGGVTVEVDRIVRPGAVVSGSVTFSDGVSGKWAMDQYGRLMLDTGQEGYKPSAPDVQAFQRELSAQLQRAGY